jgi:hypothetical protein
MRQYFLDTFSIEAYEWYIHGCGHL